MKKIFNIFFLLIFSIFLFLSFFEIGFLGIGLNILYVLYLIKKNPSIKNFMLFAIIIRLSVLFLDKAGLGVAGGKADAIVFENLAAIWSSGGFFSWLNYYPGISSEFMSWIIAFVYLFTERSLLMAQSMSLFFSISSIFICWLVASKIWESKHAIKAGWISALFPTLILYSVQVMREPYVYFFLIVAIYGVVIWTKNRSLRGIIIAIFGFTIATAFHSAMIIGGVAFIILVFIKNTKIFFKNFMIGFTNIKNITSISLIVLSFGFYFINEPTLPKLGKLNEFFDYDRYLKIVSSTNSGDLAAYGNIAQPEELSEIFYKGPIRIIYFVFSPFPWQIKDFHQLIGLLDSLIFMILMFWAWRNKKIIWSDPTLKTITIILLSYIVVFGMAVGNFGTGIRHRSKLVLMILLLVASKIPQIKLKK